MTAAVTAAREGPDLASDFRRIDEDMRHGLDLSWEEYVVFASGYRVTLNALANCYADATAAYSALSRHADTAYARFAEELAEGLAVDETTPGARPVS